MVVFTGRVAVQWARESNDSRTAVQRVRENNDGRRMVWAVEAGWVVFAAAASYEIGLWELLGSDLKVGGSSVVDVGERFLA